MKPYQSLAYTSLHRASGHRFSRKSTKAVSVSLRCQRKRECSRDLSIPRALVCHVNGAGLSSYRVQVSAKTRTEVSSMVPQTPCRLRFSYQNSITFLPHVPRTESSRISHSELVLMSRDCSSPPPRGDNCARSQIISKFLGKLP